VTRGPGVAEHVRAGMPRRSECPPHEPAEDPVAEIRCVPVAALCFAIIDRTRLARVEATLTLRPSGVDAVS
jgi:hypothetical protein